MPSYVTGCVAPSQCPYRLCAATLTPRPCQAYSASDPKTIDLTAEGCGAVTVEGLSELLEQFPDVEVLFTAPGE